MGPTLGRMGSCVFRMMTVRADWGLVSDTGWTSFYAVGEGQLLCEICGKDTRNSLVRGSVEVNIRLGCCNLKTGSWNPTTANWSSGLKSAGVQEIELYLRLCFRILTYLLAIDPFSITCSYSSPICCASQLLCVYGRQWHIRFLLSKSGMQIHIL
jgi:hypothetical protein